jgi:uncharacterized protein (TIGR03437 family)
MRVTDSCWIRGGTRVGLASLLLTGLALRAETVIYAATGLGPYKSVDDGKNWTPLSITSASTPAVPLAAYQIAVDPKNPANVFFIGTEGSQNKFFRSANAGAIWTSVALPPGITASSSQLLVDPVAPNNIYVFDPAVGAIRSSDFGQTWTTLSTPAGVFFNLSVDPAVSGVLYASITPVISRTTDFGATWTTVVRPDALPLSGVLPHGLFFDPIHPDVVFLANNIGNQKCSTPSGASANCGLFKSTAAAGWVPVDVLAAFRDLQFDRNTGDIYGTTFFDLLKSSDGGKTFLPLSATIRPAVYINPTVGRDVYLTATGELKHSTNGGDSWQTIILPPLCNILGPTCNPSRASPPRVEALAFAVAASSGAPVITLAANAFGEAPVLAPNMWAEIKGTNLAPAGVTRIWKSTDFLNNQLPTQLDGVSVKVGGKSAFIYYISPTQLNILTPPDALSSLTTVEVTNGGGTVTRMIAAQPLAPSFFVFDGTHVTATHANGALLGPSNLYPGLSTPARPNESVILYANGLGSTSLPVISGSPTQGGTLARFPEIRIGGLTARVDFAGLVSPGLFQINLVIPSGAVDGDPLLTGSHGGSDFQAGVRIAIQHE